MITLGRGIGLGIVINNQLYRGTGGGAGELGHTVLSPDGPICECGQTRLPRSLQSARRVCCEPARTASLQVDSIDALLAMVERGNPSAATILRHAGARLGLAIANLVSGDQPRSHHHRAVKAYGTGDVFFDSMRASLKDNSGRFDVPGLDPTDRSTGR